MTNITKSFRSENLCCFDATENDMEVQLDENMDFFMLPYHIQLDILSRLSLKDTLMFSATCREAHSITQDQFLWEKKLWRHAMAINLSLGRRRLKLPKSSNLLVRDPLLVDMRRLYEVLNPFRCIFGMKDKLNFENLLSKIEAPSAFSGLGFSELIDFINSIFNRQTPAYSDPFSRGRDAPTFLLFGPPETRCSKRVALSFIASKDTTFETIGLVKGKPGGVGGGVTVQYVKNVINILPVRRARPRLLQEGENGTEFCPVVAEVASQVDGLIYYLDAKCNCKQLKKDREKTSGYSLFKKKPVVESSNDTICGHNLDFDLLELDAMLRSLSPKHRPPILILLTLSIDSISGELSCASDAREVDDCDAGACAIGSKHSDDNSPYHSPADFFERLDKVDLPWIITYVDVKTLDGVHQGLNWLLERTKLTKGK